MRSFKTASVLLIILLGLSCGLLSGCGREGHSDMQSGVPYSLPYPQDLNRLYFKSGNVYFPALNNVSSFPTVYLYSDEMYLIPFTCGIDKQIFYRYVIGMTLNIKIRLAIYSSNNQGYPDKLLYILTDENIITKTTVMRYFDVEPFSLNNGLYYIAIQANTATSATMLGFNFSDTLYSLGYKLQFDLNTIYPITLFNVNSLPFTTPFPSVIDTSMNFSELTSSNIPMIGFVKQ